MELLNVDKSILVIIDLQGKLMEKIYRPQMVIQSTLSLLRLAEIFSVPVLVSEQYPKGLGKTHPVIWESFTKLKTSKAYMEKSSFGCCGDPNFEMLLAKLRPEIPSEQRQIVVAGIEAHICVMQTTLELIQDGNQVHICWDAVSCRGEECRKHALDRMYQASAVITSHESVGFEWARDKNHPGFKEMSQLFKEEQ